MLQQVWAGGMHLKCIGVVRTLSTHDQVFQLNSAVPNGCYFFFLRLGLFEVISMAMKMEGDPGLVP